MSRIGRKPIPVPAGVTVSIEPELVRVNGPKGELTERIHRDITVAQRGRGAARHAPDRPRRAPRAARADALAGGQHGRGRDQRLREALEIQGVGYRAVLKGRDLELALGYSHPVPIKAPDGIEFEVPQPTRVIVKGISKQLVGEVAANIRKQRPPEPYKGKGIRYEGEYVARKVGQARMTVTTKPQARLKRRRRVRAKVTGTAERPRISVFRSNRGICAQLIDDLDGRTLAAVDVDRGRPARPEAHGAGRQGRRAARRARQGGRHRARRVRPRRLPLPRPRQGLRRGRPRRRLSIRYEEHGIDRSVSPVRARPPGARRRDQPRRQGRQGRPALLVHGARRRRRREGRRRRRLRQGQRGPARDPEGRRAREEEPVPRAQARLDDHPPDDGRSSAPAASS